MTQTAAVETPAPTATPAPPVTETAPAATSEEAAPATDALDAAHAAMQRARKGSQKQRDLQRKADILARKTALAEQQIAQLQKRVADSDQLQEMLKKDPKAAIRKLGLNEQTVAQTFLEDNSVESIVRRLEERIDQSEKLRQEEQRQFQLQQMQETSRRAEQAFVEKVKELNDPWLSHISPQRLIRLGNEGAEELMAANERRGKPKNSGITLETIADWIKAEYGPMASKPSDEPSVVEVEASAKASKKSSSPSTLTNKLGTTKHSLPANFDQLSDREQRKLMAAQYAAATGKK